MEATIPPQPKPKPRKVQLITIQRPASSNSNKENIIPIGAPSAVIGATALTPAPILHRQTSTQKLKITKKPTYQKAKQLWDDLSTDRYYASSLLTIKNQACLKNEKEKLDKKYGKLKGEFGMGDEEIFSEELFFGWWGLLFYLRKNIFISSNFEIMLASVWYFGKEMIKKQEKDSILNFSN